MEIADKYGKYSFQKYQGTLEKIDVLAVPCCCN